MLALFEQTTLVQKNLREEEEGERKEASAPVWDWGPIG